MTNDLSFTNLFVPAGDLYETHADRASDLENHL
jgi:hypothetical protein